MPDTHLILYHKQSTSARTRFLRFRHGGVCGPEVLPADATVDDPGGGNAATLLTHPGMLLRATETALDLARGSLASDAGFHCRVFAGADSGDVYLAHFTSIDPPFEGRGCGGRGIHRSHSGTGSATGGAGLAAARLRARFGLKPFPPTPYRHGDSNHAGGAWRAASAYWCRGFRQGQAVSD